MKITQTALVEHCKTEMFNLINDINSYPEFIPWCTDAKIFEKNEEFVIAKLDIEKSGIKSSFTTKNYLYKPDKIQLTLQEGPFSNLEGTWNFKEIGNNACRVDFNISFEIKNRLLKFPLEKALGPIASSLVDIFIKRATDIYKRDIKRDI